MGNCSSPKRKIPIPIGDEDSRGLKKVLMEPKIEKNTPRRAMSREEILSTSNIINLNLGPTSNKDNNENDKETNINNINKMANSYTIKFLNSSNGSIKSKSKGKIPSVKNLNINVINNNNNPEINRYIHIKHRSNSSRADTLSLNSSHSNNFTSSKTISRIYYDNKSKKTGSKCKNKNQNQNKNVYKIPRSTYNTINNKNFRNCNCKIKPSKYYCNTYDDINDENINIINKNIFNIYNNNNININFYQNKSSNTTAKKEKNCSLYKCINTIEGHQEKIVSMVELSNHLIATGSYDCKIKIWEIKNGICVKTIQESGYVFCLLEMEPNLILSGTNKNSVQLFDINSELNEEKFSFKGHELWINCLVKCNNSYFASGSNDAEIKVWDFNNKTLFKTLKGHEDCILTMIILKNQNLCSGSADLTLRIWDWEVGNCVATLAGHEKWVKSICQLDSGYIVSGSDDMTIKIWKDNKIIKEFLGHTHSVRSLCKISEDEFASGSFDGTIKIWNINSSDSIQTLYGHQSYVISIIKNFNGNLISCSNDHTMKVWKK